MSAERVGPGVHLIDLRFLDQPDVIAAGLVELDGGIAIVDPGPASTVDHLVAGLEAAGCPLTDVTHLLLTHIHLDHAGASGTLVARHPNLHVVVHAKGAPHLVDPSKLWRSAGRLFGEDRMAMLWGTTLPVPADRLLVIERAADHLFGRQVEIAYTPGHASHHQAYLHRGSGIAFTGDAAGARIRNVRAVLPATPPPEIDVRLLQDSLRRIVAWDPDRLFLTHFGLADDPAWHAHEFDRRLDEWSDRVRASLDEPGEDDDRAARFGAAVLQDLRSELGRAITAAYQSGASPSMSWYGLARYHRKRAA